MTDSLLLPSYGFHDVPAEQDPAVLAQAYLDCFNSPAGHTVLNAMYWATVMTAPAYGEEGQRHMGRINFFQEIIANMQQGVAARRNGHG